MSVLPRLKKIGDALSTVAVIVVAVILVWNQFRPAAGSRTPSTAIEPQVRLDAAFLANRVGESNIVLVEFADFECPACARYAIETHPRIKKDLIDAGKLSYVFLNFPLERLHPSAFKASEAVECSGKQGKYWEMHARLFLNPKELTIADLIKHAAAVGVDEPIFARCLAGEAAAKVKSDMAQGKKLGVPGTPTFFVGKIAEDGGVMISRRLNGLASVKELRSLIDELTGGRKWLPWLGSR